MSMEELQRLGQEMDLEALGWERGMRDAANICAALAETTFDDADAFEAATGCEAAIINDLRMHQGNRGKAQTAGWQPIETAKKDRTVIWAVLRNDLYPQMHPGRENLERWNGVQVPLRHPGLADDGFDVGWSVAAPVGHGGFPDNWIAGWMPLPTSPIQDTTA